MIATVWGVPLVPLIILGIVVIGAGFVQATAGFGFALLAVPLMSLVVPPETAVVVVFLQGVCSSLLTARRHRAHVAWVEAKRLSIGAIVAMPLGVVVLVTASPNVLRLALGAVTCPAAIWMLLPSTRRRPAFEAPPAVTYVVGAVSGVLNTALATNGPPLVIYLRARDLDINTFRSTISTVFTVSGVAGLVVLLIGRAVHAVACEYFVLTLVPALLGWLLGNATAGKLRNEFFVRMVDVLLLVSGLLAIAKAVVG
jgi:uncharacterized membrane protein YfcA